MIARLHKAMKDREEGFTLIELLVVIIIIGILAAIAIPVFLNQRKKGVDASIKADVRNAATALETYITDNPNAGTFAAGTAVGAGFKSSPGNTIQVTGGTTAGYCIRGQNANGSGGATSYFWYDSANGGLQSGGSTGAAPAGATTCSGTPTWVAA